MGRDKVVSADGYASSDGHHVVVGFEESYYSRISNPNGNLMALKCHAPGYEGTQTGLDQIYLILEEDFDSTYLKNDTINEIALINLPRWHIYSYNNPASLGYMSFNKFIQKYDDVIYDYGFDIVLTRKPAIGAYISLKFVCILDNGDEFTATTDRCRLYY